MSDIDDSKGALAEFTALRQEIQQRAQMQHQLLSLQLTLSGAVIGFSLSDSGRTLFLSYAAA